MEAIVLVCGAQLLKGLVPLVLFQKAGLNPVFTDYRVDSIRSDCLL